MDHKGNIIPDLAKQMEAKKCQFMSKWGMHEFESSFPRLHDKIMYEEKGERKLKFCCLVFLFNFRTSTVGFNQIKTVYMPHLKEAIVIH